MLALEGNRSDRLKFKEGRPVVNGMCHIYRSVGRHIHVCALLSILIIL